MRRLSVATILVLSLRPSFGEAQCINYADYTHWVSSLPLPGSPGRMAASGSRVYVCTGSTGLAIVDVSNPHFPRVIHVLDTPGSCSDVRVEGSHCLLADGATGLLAVDVSVPSNPVIVNTFDPGAISVVEVSGTLAVAAGGGGFYTLDVTDPASPGMLGSVGLPAGSPNDLELNGSHGYLATTSGLRIIDVTDPASPMVVGYLSCSSSYGFNGVDVEGPYAYLADVFTTFEYGALRVADVSDPAQPVVVAVDYIYGFVNDVAVIDRKAYLTDAAYSLYMFDVSDPLNPALERELFSSEVFRILVDGGFLYLTHRFSPGRLHIIDVSGPVEPPIVTSIGTSATRDIEVRGSYAYHSGTGGPFGYLKVLDVTDPSAPVSVGSLQLQHAERLEVEGNFAYILQGDLGLAVADISNPALPTLRSSLDTPGWACDAGTGSDFVYVADCLSDPGLVVIQVTDPDNPAIVGQVPTPGDANGLAYHLGRVYVACSEAGLAVYDVSSPTAPVLVATVPTQGSAIDVAIRGSHAYVNQCGGLMIFDISNPMAPMEVGSAQTPSCAHSGIAFQGDFVYLAEYSENIAVFNVADPAAPWYVGSHHGIYDAYGLAVVGDYLYACDDGENQIHVLPLQCVVSGAAVAGPAGIPSLSAPFPNPSAGPVTIRYHVPAAGETSLAVFDLHGRRVRGILDGWVEKGRQITFWDGQDDRRGVPGDGTYFVRLMWQGKAMVQKVILLR